MDVVRTPEERFANLPEYPFEPHYREVDGLRMHYVDEGPREAAPILLLHGEPTWSYLYRKMIPPLVAAGHRVLAPDLIGFGKSDKPVARSAYSYQAHADWLRSWIEALDLKNITLFCQDWGSLLGLRLAAQHQERFARICVGNGFLPTATRPVPFAFHLWRAFSRYSPLFPIGRIVASGCVTKLGKDVIAAYDAPFPSGRHKTAARVFPSLVPIHENDPAVPDNRAAWEALGRWDKAFLCVFGKNDPILGRADAPLIAHVPGAAGQPHARIWGGHFVQEDRGDELARRLNDWLASA